MKFYLNSKLLVLAQRQTIKLVKYTGEEMLFQSKIKTPLPLNSTS